MERNTKSNFSPGVQGSNHYLCVLEKTQSGYSGFLADFELVLATGRTKQDVLEYLSQELQAMQKSGDLTSARVTDEEFADEYDVEFAYVSPAAPNPVSAQLEDLVRREGKKQKDVAEALGVSSAAVSRLTSPYYHGHSLDSLQRFAQALGYEVELKFKKVN